MTIMEVTGSVIKKKRKRKISTDENDCSQAPAKAAKISTEKKTVVKRQHSGDVSVKSDMKKMKPMKKTMRTDENKKKSKMVRNMLKYFMR